MKQLSPTIQKDLEQFGYRYIPLPKRVEEILLEKDNFIYLLKGKHRVKQIYCVHCHAMSLSHHENCFFCSKMMNNYQVVYKPQEYFHTIDDVIFHYNTANVSYKVKDMIVRERETYGSKQYNDKIELPLSFENISCSIDFETGEVMFNEYVTNYKLHIHYTKKLCYLTKDNKKITLRDFVKENNETALTKLMNLFVEKLLLKRLNLKPSNMSQTKQLVGYLVLAMDSNLFYEDVHHYDFKAIHYYKILSLDCEFKIDESKYSTKAFQNLISSYAVSKTKEIHYRVLNKVLENYPDKLATYAEQYRGYNLVFITWYLTNNLDEKKLEKWITLLDSLVGNKHLMIPLIKKFNLDADTFGNYLNYLEQYEALTKGKATQYYIKYLSNQTETELSKIDLYPKDILIKL